jgi:hypothetical protein
MSSRLGQCESAYVIGYRGNYVLMLRIVESDPREAAPQELMLSLIPEPYVPTAGRYVDSESMNHIFISYGIICPQ